MLLNLKISKKKERYFHAVPKKYLTTAVITASLLALGGCHHGGGGHHGGGVPPNTTNVIVDPGSEVPVSDIVDPGQILKIKLNGGVEQTLDPASDKLDLSGATAGLSTDTTFTVEEGGSTASGTMAIYKATFSAVTGHTITSDPDEIVVDDPSDINVFEVGAIIVAAVPTQAEIDNLVTTNSPDFTYTGKAYDGSSTEDFNYTVSFGADVTGSGNIKDSSGNTLIDLNTASLDSSMQFNGTAVDLGDNSTGSYKAQLAGSGSTANIAKDIVGTIVFDNSNIIFGGSR